MMASAEWWIVLFNISLLRANPIFNIIFKHWSIHRHVSHKLTDLKKTQPTGTKETLKNVNITTLHLQSRCHGLLTMLRKNLLVCIILIAVVWTIYIEVVAKKANGSWEHEHDTMHAKRKSCWAQGTYNSISCITWINQVPAQLQAALCLQIFVFCLMPLLITVSFLTASF